MKIDKKINWDSFSETEQQAIGISNSNSINGTNNPEFPYIAAVFEAVAEELENIAQAAPNAAIQFVKEANVIVRKLIELSPIPPTTDIEELAEQYSEDELASRLLGCTVCDFLAYQFAQMETQIIAQLETQIHGGRE
ncbi:hypothetical protein [Avibacterium paragallinarum]|uniref:Uncharacterized protein n=1 Tax=Avibacterium paragallinarum TaxID=728 RepID=A0ABU7QHE2_AVIPA